MDIVIRAAVPAEYEELGEVTARVYLGDGHLTFGEDDPYLARLRDVAGRAGTCEILVAVGHDGRLLGGVTFAPPASGFCDIARADEAEFRMLAVAREARGRGAGEALVRACVERARAVEGVRRLVLSTSDDMAGAHRLYERLGFERTPGRDWEPFPGLTLLTYGLEL